MNNPLFRKVQSIVLTQARQNQIRHTAFSSIRNQASIRSIMTEIGYKADCETKPVIWTRKKAIKVQTVKLMPEPISNKDKLKRGTVYNHITELLESKKTIYIKDLPVHRKYVVRILHKLSKTMKIEVFKEGEHKGVMAVVAFRLSD